MQDKEDTPIPALREQLNECEKGIENMLNAIQMGILTASAKTRLEEPEARQNELKLSMMQAELQKPKYTKEQIVSCINRFKYGDEDDIEYQKQIIDTFINAICVFDDKLVFTCNFKDGTEAIPLKTVEDAFGSDLTQAAPPKNQDSDCRQKAGAVKIKPNISRNKYLSIWGYGALPHRPTKGLSARPLETFGRKYLVFFLKYRSC